VAHRYVTCHPAACGRTVTKVRLRTDVTNPSHKNPILPPQQPSHTTMFQSQTHRFGKWTVYELTHPGTGCSLQVVPARGGCLAGLSLAGQSVLEPFPDEQSMDQMAAARNALLFPFPNRLKHGAYRLGDQVLQFPINNPETGNAIHGYCLFADMEVLDVQLEPEKAVLRLQYEDEGKHPAYPFAFRLETTYEVRIPNELVVTTRIENQSFDKMPFGLGWHPYFTLGGPIEASELTLPTAEKIEVDNYRIPTGNRTFYNAFASARPIAETVFDDCLRLAGEGLTKAFLHGPGGQLEYWQESGEGKYNFLQVYTPPSRTSICFEPMSCNIDAFNNGDGLQWLAPGGTAEMTFGCKLFK
jgi:aldose 1-epimerase